MLMHWQSSPMQRNMQGKAMINHWTEPCYRAECSGGCGRKGPVASSATAAINSIIAKKWTVLDDRSIFCPKCMKIRKGKKHNLSGEVK